MPPPLATPAALATPRTIDILGCSILQRRSWSGWNVTSHLRGGLCRADLRGGRWIGDVGRLGPVKIGLGPVGERLRQVGGLCECVGWRCVVIIIWRPQRRPEPMAVSLRSPSIEDITSTGTRGNNLVDDLEVSPPVRCKILEVRMSFDEVVPCVPGVIRDVEPALVSVRPTRCTYIHPLLYLQEVFMEFFTLQRKIISYQGVRNLQGDARPSICPQ
jgi:hypothetical protein